VVLNLHQKICLILIHQKIFILLSFSSYTKRKIYKQEIIILVYLKHIIKMEIGKETIKRAYELNSDLHKDTSQYYHSKPVAASRSDLALYDETKHSFNIIYDLKDLFTIGAITQSSTLMTGGTDVGKTTLAKLVMNSLLGSEEKGWHRIDIDTDFGKDAYTDVDFGAMKDGKKLSEGMYKKMWFLDLPGLILDEINRAHAAIINKLLHVFDKDISLPDGSRAKIGFPINGDGSTYQFQVAAINEGKAYAGTFEIDKALRRRTLIEIPMDIFPPTPYDRLCIQKNGKKDIEFRNEKNRLEDIVKVYNKVKNLSLHPSAELFVSYLESFDYCKNSFTSDKGGVASKHGTVRHICTQPFEIGGERIGEDGVGCRFLKAFENELCPNVRGLTPGVSKNLINVAKGFALLRATKFVELMAGSSQNQFQKPLSYSIESPNEFKVAIMKYVGGPIQGKELAQAAINKYFDNLKVEIGDIEASMGFVGYSKIGMCNLWVEKKFQGNRNEAIRYFCRETRSKFEEGLSREELTDLENVLQGSSSSEEINAIREYCKNENPWLWRTLVPYMEDKDSGNISPEEIHEFYE